MRVPGAQQVTIHGVVYRVLIVWTSPEWWELRALEVLKKGDAEHTRTSKTNVFKADRNQSTVTETHIERQREMVSPQKVGYTESDCKQKPSYFRAAAGTRQKMDADGVRARSDSNKA